MGGEFVIMFILAAIISAIVAIALVWVIASLLLTGFKPELIRPDGSIDWAWSLAITALTVAILYVLIFIYKQTCRNMMRRMLC